MPKFRYFSRPARPAAPPSRLDRLLEVVFWIGVAVLLGSWLAPGLLGTLVKSMARTFGLMLVFLLLARALSARIREIFGGGR